MAGTDILKDIKNIRPNYPRGQFGKKILPQLFINAVFLPFTEFLGELTKYQGAQIIVTIFFFGVY